MKRLICGVAALLLLISLSACGKPAQPSSKKPRVIATVFPPYDFVRQIAGDTVELSMLISPNEECHSFDLSVSDILSIEACDLFLYTGGESDAHIESLLSSMNDDAPESIRLMDSVTPLSEETVEGMETDPAEDHGALLESFDEHVWTSPQNAILIVRSIEDRLCTLFPAHADLYHQNADAYVEQLSALDADFAEMVNNAPMRTIVVGDRFPFRYLADAYGLSYFAAFNGCSEETDASVATIVFLTDKVREMSIPTVFYIEFSNHRIADTIAEETGASTAMLHSCHNVTANEWASGATYLSLMRQNLSLIREALYGCW